MAKAFPSVVDRYFTRYFWTDINKKVCEDQCVLVHSNRICVITLAKTHRLLNGETPIKVNYSPDNKINRLENKVSGKGKRGGQWLDKMSILCEITTDTGSSYMLRSCIQGKLIEINENLIQHPELLVSKTETDGFLAIISPKIQNIDNLCSHLSTNKQYEDLVLKRKSQAIDQNVKPTEELIT